MTPKIKPAHRPMATLLIPPPGMRNLTCTLTGCSTPNGILAIGKRLEHAAGAGDGDVLNALRHLGDRQSTDNWSGTATGCECSTPYGILATGNLADVAGDQVDAAPVLNALRHRGDRQHTDPVINTAGAMCSTPYGIVAIGNAVLEEVVESMIPVCSTPYGIVAIGKDHTC